MGNLNANTSFEYYNATINGTYDTLYLEGFASAAHSRLGSRDIYQIRADGSLSLSHAETADIYAFNNFARGRGAFAETDFSCDDGKTCDLECSGEDSCTKANITTDDCVGFKTCSGAQSCAHSMHSMSSRCFAEAYGGGAMSYYESSLITGGSETDFYFELGGFLAGYGFDIYCNGTDECVVSCATPMACLNTTVHCLNESSCSLDYDCDNSKGVFCPTMIRYNETDEDRIGL